MAEECPNRKRVRRAGQAPRRDLIVRVEHTVRPVAAEEGEPVRPRTDEVEAVASLDLAEWLGVPLVTKDRELVSTLVPVLYC